LSLMIAVQGHRIKREDRFRCQILEPSCQYYCQLILQSDGTCDENDECICSGEHLEKHVCSDNVEKDVGKYLCAGYCQGQIKQSGECNYNTNECECTAEELELEHLQCLTPWICKFGCHIRGYKTGQCAGKNNWDCLCVGKEKENEVEPIQSNDKFQVENMNN